MSDDIDIDHLVDTDDRVVREGICSLVLPATPAAWTPVIQEFFDITVEWIISILSDIIGISASNPTYRTKPIEGAELGGAPRNPEDNVIDEIDQLVDWQIRHGETGGW